MNHIGNRIANQTENQTEKPPGRTAWTSRAGITGVTLSLAATLLGIVLSAGGCSAGDNAEPAAPASTEPTTPAKAEPAPSAIEAYLDRLETSGFNGVVALRDGSDITTRAYGLADRENGVPTDAETVFDIGSLSKQFTAAAILRLEMDGLLSVEDTLGQHVPGLPEDTAAVTLHQLLTHTAGVYPNSLGPDDEAISRDDYIALVAETPLASPPGDGFAYSNVGYSLLAAVIEFATGGTYEDYLEMALFDPAGMTDTGYVLPDWSDHTIAVGYTGPSGIRFGRPDEQTWDANGPYWHLHGNGGLLSTAADMLRWDAALRGEDVLNPAAKAKLFATHVPNSFDQGVGYGYGWVIVETPMGTPLITHNGGNGTFFADYLRLTEEDFVIFIATNSSGNEGDLAFELAELAVLGALPD